MILIAAILFVSTLVGGLLNYWIPFRSEQLKLPLVFGGSFLFAITIIHILPELFTVSEHPFRVGLFVLIGFFFQQFLETFSVGVEHGHIHKEKLHSKPARIALIIALMLHSILEGALLMHESPFHEQHESHSLLFGIIFHKVPAAFVLMALIRRDAAFRLPEFFILLLFSVASPIGLALSNSVDTISAEHLTLLFALVSGSFLHISTTIFVETSPNHKLGPQKIAVSLFGAILAIAIEFLG